MSFAAKFDIFIVLDTLAKLKAGVPIAAQDCSFIENRGARNVDPKLSDFREVRRFAHDKSLAITKLCDNHQEASAVNEKRVVDWIRSQLAPGNMWAIWARDHAELSEAANTHKGIQFRQGFAGIDVHDLIFKILEHARSDRTEFADRPLNRDPSVLLLIWRHVIQCLIHMHRLGLIHGDASDENFCCEIHTFWSPAERRFRMNKDFKVKAIDFGCTLMPPSVRAQFLPCIRHMREGIETVAHPDYANAIEDQAIYLGLGPSVDYYTLANYIHHSTNALFPQNGTCAPFESYVLGEPVGVPDRLDRAMRLLIDLPEKLRLRGATSMAPHSGDPRHLVYQVGFYEAFVQEIDRAILFDDIGAISFACPKPAAGANDEAGATVRRDQPAQTSSSAAHPRPAKRSTWVGVGIASAAVCAAAAIYVLSNSANPAKQAAAQMPTPSVAALKTGVVAKSDPNYLACTADEARQAVEALISGSAGSAADRARLAIAPALKACQALLPRAEPAHSTHLIAMALAAYYALVTSQIDQAQSLLDPALILDDSKDKSHLSGELARVWLAQAAISARKGNEAAMYLALEKAAALGQIQQNLDDDCPLHAPYNGSAKYQLMRSTFAPGAYKPAKPLTTPAC